MEFQPIKTAPDSGALVLAIPGLWTDWKLMKPWANIAYSLDANVQIFDHQPIPGDEMYQDVLGLAHLEEVIVRHISGTRFHTIDLIGHSMGGLVAQMVLHKMQQLQSRQTVRATLVSPAPPRGVFLRGGELYARMVRAMITFRMSKKSFTPLEKDLHALMFNEVPEENMPSDFPPERRKLVWDIVLGRIKVPPLGRNVRILSGLKDNIITHGTCLKLAEYHGCELQPHSGGHMPFIEKSCMATGALAINDTWGW